MQQWKFLIMVMNAQFLQPQEQPDKEWSMDLRTKPIHNSPVVFLSINILSGFSELNFPLMFYAAKNILKKILPLNFYRLSAFFDWD